MNDIFIKLFNMSIAASWLILAAIAVRPLVKKASKRMLMLVWALVAIRLIVPIGIKSSLSLVPSETTLERIIGDEKNKENAVNADEVILHSGIGFLNSAFAVENVDAYPSEKTELPKQNDGGVETAAFKVAQKNKTPRMIGGTVEKLGCIWFCGAAVMLIYCAASFSLVSRRVKGAEHIKENIYSSENADTAFVLGVVRPKIYLPKTLEKGREYVIAHEKTHISRGDHIYKLVGFILLSLHWFNPLVWVSYALLCRDMEYACDERIIASMDRSERADYSETLLNCTIKNRSITACPLAFGGTGTLGRIKGILNYKKPAFIFYMLAVFALIALAVFFSTSRKGKNNNGGAQMAKPTETTMRSLEELKSGYTMEQAIEDGCVVVSNFELISGENIWLRFYNDARSGIPANVRLYQQYDDAEIKDGVVYYVKDLSYDGEKYRIVFYDRTGDTNEEFLSDNEYKYLIRGSGNQPIFSSDFWPCRVYVLSDDPNRDPHDYFDELLSSYADPNANWRRAMALSYNSLGADDDGEEENSWDHNYNGYYDEAYFDIDGDGKDEKCTLGMGQTSGVFSFTFSVYKNDECVSKKCYVMRGAYTSLGFVRDENGEYRVVALWQRESHLWDVRADTMGLYKNYRIIKDGNGITLEMNGDDYCVNDELSHDND